MNYYDILGVSKTATQDEIKKAYRKKASTEHPDKGGDTVKFQEINNAYSTLSDPVKRQEYDNPPQQNHFGSGPFNPGSGPNPFGHNDLHNMFSHMFGQQFRSDARANKNIKIELWITLEETLIEQKKTINISGNGVNRPAVDITVMRGVFDGDTIRYPGLGDNSIKDLPAGDLHVVYRIQQHPIFTPQPDALYQEVKITCFDAILGTNVSVKTLDGKELSVTIPPGTQYGTRMKIKGEGLYSLHHPNKSDMILVINVLIPVIQKTDETSDILEQVRKLKEILI